MLALFVGTAENRTYIDPDEDPEMPDLIDINGKVIDPDDEITELEKYKQQLIKLVSRNDDIYYYTVDPLYSNVVKKDYDPKYYLGHYRCNLKDLPCITTTEDIYNNLYKQFDYIVITSCYQNFFNKENVDKLNNLLKSPDVRTPLVYILYTVKYNISDYMRENLLYKFIEVD